MSMNFTMQIREKNDNLYIRAVGAFDDSSAGELLALIETHHKGTGRVFVDTRDIQAVYPLGSNVFRSRFSQGCLAPEKLFFKGEKGFSIAPNGSRVIIAPEKKSHGHVCCGRCAHCTCRRNKETQAN